MDLCHCSRCTGVEWLNEEEYEEDLICCKLCGDESEDDQNPFKGLTMYGSEFICFKCFCCYCKREREMEEPDYYNVEIPAENFTKVAEDKYACDSCLSKKLKM